MSTCPRRLLSTKEAMCYLGIGKMLWLDLGIPLKLTSLGFGTKKDLWDIRELDRFIDDVWESKRTKPYVVLEKKYRRKLVMPLHKEMMRTAREG